MKLETAKQLKPGDKVIVTAGDCFEDQDPVEIKLKAKVIRFNKDFTCCLIDVALSERASTVTRWAHINRLKRVKCKVSPPKFIHVNAEMTEQLNKFNSGLFRIETKAREDKICYKLYKPKKNAISSIPKMTVKSLEEENYKVFIEKYPVVRSDTYPLAVQVYNVFRKTGWTDEQLIKEGYMLP